MPQERPPLSQAELVPGDDGYSNGMSDERSRPLTHLQNSHSDHSSPQFLSLGSEDNGPGSQEIELPVDQEFQEIDHVSPAAIVLGETRRRTDRSKSPARRYLKRVEHESGIYEITYDRKTDVQQVVQIGPEQKITDPILLRRGITAQMYLFGSEGDEERHFKDFRKRDTPVSFFKAGRVFRTLWVENRENNAKKTISAVKSIHTEMDKRIFARVRMFVVIREAENYCTALPVVLCGRMGTPQSSWKKSNHGIIYTGQEVPTLLDDERPAHGEQGMRSEPIRVSPDNPRQKLDAASRLDYASVVTLHHDVKVQNFGIVHSKSMKALMRQFREVWKDRDPLNVVAPIAPASDDGNPDANGTLFGQDQPVEHANEAGPVRDTIEETAHRASPEFPETLDQYQANHDIAYPELQHPPPIANEEENLLSEPSVAANIEHLDPNQSQGFQTLLNGRTDRQDGGHQRSRTVDDTLSIHRRRRLSLSRSDPFSDTPEVEKTVPREEAKASNVMLEEQSAGEKFRFHVPETPSHHSIDRSIVAHPSMPFDSDPEPHRATSSTRPGFVGDNSAPEYQQLQDLDVMLSLEGQNSQEWNYPSLAGRTYPLATREEDDFVDQFATGQFQQDGPNTFDRIEEQTPETVTQTEDLYLSIPVREDPKHGEKAEQFSKQLRRLRRKVGDVLRKRTQWRYETQRLEYTRQYLQESLAPLMTALNTQKWIDSAPTVPKGNRKKRRPRNAAIPKSSSQESSSQTAYSSSGSDILVTDKAEYESISPNTGAAIPGTSDISALYEQYMKDFRNIEAIEKGLKDVMAELNEQEYGLQSLLTKLTETMQSAHFADELRQQMLDEPLPTDYESSHAPSEPEELHPLVAEYFSRAGDVNVYYERLQELDDAYEEDIADREFRRDIADPDPESGIDEGIEAVERQYVEDRMKLERDLENAREETAQLAERCKLAGLNPQLYRHSEPSLQGEGVNDAFALHLGPEDPRKSMNMVQNWLHDMNDTDMAHWEDPAAYGGGMEGRLDGQIV